MFFIGIATKKNKIKTHCQTESVSVYAMDLLSDSLLESESTSACLRPFFSVSAITH